MFELRRTPEFFVGSFSAMASPCEVLIDTEDEVLARKVSESVAGEATRIEKKFSRYRDDNLIYEINKGSGRAVEVDEEFARLFDFADQCFQLSEGLFDITSGVLRRIWKFDGSDNIPSRKQAKTLLPLIGWEKVRWHKPLITVPEGMEVDLGGIGKEYAVDSAMGSIQALTDIPVMINFGGDLFASKPPKDKKHWSVGVESIGGNEAGAMIQLTAGALATSGDARRFLQKNGKRYPHVLNPKTAWPVMKAPRAVTVAANTCIEAGFLSTMAMLKGKQAREFLEAQQVLFWIQA